MLDRVRFKTVQEIADLSGIPRATLYFWLKAEKLKTYRNDLEDQIFIDLNEFNEKRSIKEVQSNDAK